MYDILAFLKWDSFSHDIEPSRHRNQHGCVTASKLRIDAGEKQTAGWLLPVVLNDQTRRQLMQGSRVHSLLPHGVRAAHRAFGIAFTLNRPVWDQNVGAALLLILRKIASDVLIAEMVFDFVYAPALKRRAFVARHTTHFKAPCASVSES